MHPVSEKVANGTGCGPSDHRGAGEALARYIAAKYEPPGAIAAAELFIDEIIAAYLTEHAAFSPSRELLVHTSRPIFEWWSGKKLVKVNGTNCRNCVAWRSGQKHRRAKARKKISEQTARHDLKTLRTAINWYHREHGPLMIVPTVSLPQRQSQRPDYWLTREQVAARVRAVRKSKATHHVARQLLIGV